MKNCLYFTTDLMFTSRVHPVANAAGFRLKFPGFESADFEDSVDLVIFDLGSVSSAEVSQCLQTLSEKKKIMPKTVAYGPHVKADLLEAAKQAGVELVWTRGQFNQQFNTLFLE